MRQLVTSMGLGLALVFTAQMSFAKGLVAPAPFWHDSPAGDWGYLQATKSAKRPSMISYCEGESQRTSKKRNDPEFAESWAFRNDYDLLSDCFAVYEVPEVDEMISVVNGKISNVESSIEKLSKAEARVSKLVPQLESSNQALEQKVDSAVANIPAQVEAAVNPIISALEVRVLANLPAQQSASVDQAQVRAIVKTEIQKAINEGGLFESPEFKQLVIDAIEKTWRK